MKTPKVIWSGVIGHVAGVNRLAKRLQLGLGLTLLPVLAGPGPMTLGRS